MANREPFMGVRPTIRCVKDDLEVDLPSLGTRLEDMSHPLIERAQSIPDVVAGGGAERIAALDDLVWLKVKTSNLRGAVTSDGRKGLTPSSSAIPAELGSWWLGAAGVRQADSAQSDFYARLEAECLRARGAASEQSQHRTSSVHLLPKEIDWRRLLAEMATQARLRIAETVRDMARKSLESGSVINFELENYAVRVLVRADDGHEVYIARSLRSGIEIKLQ